jgi:ATPase subunit of ABC transporter with duplicated ATPase domains
MSFKFSGQKNYFFHNAHITFESGNNYFIQGKNGVGKSTFFAILQGTTTMQRSPVPLFLIIKNML